MSQLDMVRFIYEHRKVFLPNAFDKPLLKLTGLGSPHCTTVSEATPVKEALRTLFEQNLNATACRCCMGAYSCLLVSWPNPSADRTSSRT